MKLKILFMSTSSLIYFINHSISGFLDALVEKNRNVATATPPPSPTQGSHSPSPARGLFGSDLQSSLHSSKFFLYMITYFNQYQAKIK